ncbi:uncharacterized protein NECHADRAFT_82730 [Fusarium vanettenii 77-13-4]|uniref:Nephrocystin 3-like N-terminal domain-containing protein n=1 Tax=Fusarium vanettenii (strain ATCC MYA-4622 / CBS 123669 / FGSC 9596 / NRRL 45880 / 77-13-4) TaxID=660122 RepID=C7YY23_FUSV7|nr:uncharacterized protein NECHADRAFT_82730 [Fusarium vanettenii 77-13-4]EEU43693.1 hypothetical protein NECHADRAFT_82730 [Fusarium vanettenii 77-13-4]
MEVTASIIAVLQLSERVIGACKWYIDAYQDYPKDLRLIYLETSSIRAVFETLSFLDPHDPEDSEALQILKRPDGPIAGCNEAIGELSKLLPLANAHSGARKSKKKKLESTWTTLAWPLKCEKARKLLDELNSHKATINMTLTGQILYELGTVQNAVDIANQTLTYAQKREVCDWLEIVNPSPNHNAAVDLYVDGTGDWVFRSQPWNDWIDRKSRVIWMHGIPDAGNTVLTAHLFRHILKRCEQSSSSKVECVYFYCYHGHNRDETMPFLRWLLSQLCRKTSKVPNPVYHAFRSHLEPSKIRGEAV